MSDPKRTILVVDDDPDIVESHSLMLKQAGYSVISAGSRKEAVDLLNTVRPDAAIVDLMMDEMDDGFVLAHHLKRLIAGLPVIIVSAVISETGMEFDDGTGRGNAWVEAEAVMSKPVRMEELLATVKRLIEASASKKVNA